MKAMTMKMAIETEAARSQIRAVTDGWTVLAAAEIAATPERIFRALTTEEVEAWWGSSDTYRLTEWLADFRIGGKWTVSVRCKNGIVIPAGGEFIEICWPGKVVQTRRYDWDHPTLGRDVTTVSYRFDAISSGTRVTVRHDGFAGRTAAADEHAAGWERVLGWLRDDLQPETD
jgi:uncharacterized protein YndB with AHSA1/START domain